LTVRGEAVIDQAAQPKLHVLFVGIDAETMQKSYKDQFFFKKVMQYNQYKNKLKKYISGVA
jgi:hypothetical protein